MVDFFSRSLDSRTSTTNLRFFFPPKQFRTAFFPAISFPRNPRTRRRSLISPASLNPNLLRPLLVQISISFRSTHSDGSILFRFGDLSESEITDNVKPVEPENLKEIKKGSQEGYGVVKVLDGDIERQVMVKKLDNEVRSVEELSEHSKIVELEIDDANSIGINNESINVVERDNESSERVSKDSKKVKFAMDQSNIIGLSVLEKENESNDKLSEDSPLLGATSLDESSIVDNADDVTDNTGIEQSTGETLAAINVSADNQSMEALTQIGIGEDGKSEMSEVKPVSPQLELSTSASRDTEDQDLGIGMPTEITEDGNTSDTNVVAIDFSGDLKDRDYEATADISEGSKDQNLEGGNGMASKIVENGSQSDMIEVMAVSPKVEAESFLDEEADNFSMEEAVMADRNDSEMMLENSQSISEPRTGADDDRARNNDFVEASSSEATELKPVESVERRIEEVLVVSSGVAFLPHPSKVLTGGEDAYFIGGQTWLGVADGVSQWSLQGVNPGVYAQELIKNCENVISEDLVDNPVEVLQKSVARAESPGASTVLIAHFDGQALHVANIGDSEFMILRHGTVYKRSSPMFHEFHFPVQIERGDEPSCLTEEYRVDLEEGDVIITATDGLFDNLFDEEISSIVVASLDSDKQLEEIAELLAKQAQEVGRSSSARSPFADAARAAGYAGYSGGKLDDVTVLYQSLENNRILHLTRSSWNVEFMFHVDMLIRRVNKIFLYE